MYTIVGLQNPGTKYVNTRHNVGAQIVCALQERMSLPSVFESKQYSGSVSEGVVEGHEVRVLLPETYMNNSGTSVRKAITREEASEKLIVVYDDIDLPIGSFRVSHGRGSGGHNGVQSVIDALGTNAFTRVRIGIAPVSFFGKTRKPPRERVAAFVLQGFSRKEQRKIDSLMLDVIEAVRTVLTDGYTVAMNRFN